MNVYQITDHDDSQLVVAGSMRKAISVFIQKVYRENDGEDDFSYSEDDIDQCALIGEVWAEEKP